MPGCAAHDRHHKVRDFSKVGSSSQYIHFFNKYDCCDLKLSLIFVQFSDDLMTKVNIFNLDSTGIRCLVTENRTACIVSKVGLRLNLHQQKSHQLLKSQQPLGDCLRHQDP